MTGLAPDGPIMQYVGTIDDVTQKVELEKAKKRAETDALVARGRAEAERDTATYLPVKILQRATFLDWTHCFSQP